MCIEMSGKCSHVLSYIGCMGIIIRAHTQYKLRVHVYMTDGIVSVLAVELRLCMVCNLDLLLWIRC